jgi:hypothetical protein
VLCHSVSCDAKVLLASGIIPPTISARKRFGTCAVKAAGGNSGRPRPRDGLQEWEGARMETVADHLLPFMSGWRGTGESPPRSTDNGERLERGGGKRRVIGEEWRRDKGDWGRRRSEGASGSPEEDGLKEGRFPSPTVA